jgi:hypothetical protein
MTKTLMPAVDNDQDFDATAPVDVESAAAAAVPAAEAKKAKNLPKSKASSSVCSRRSLNLPQVSATGVVLTPPTMNRADF